MTILAIETSCDETAVAILRDGELLASEVASQTAEHQRFGGVVPELASRNHLAQLPPLLERALASATVTMKSVDAFAATSGPGLASSLLVGHSAAKGLAIGGGKPFLAINHLEGHLLSPFFGPDQPLSAVARAVAKAELFPNPLKERNATAPTAVPTHDFTKVDRGLADSAIPPHLALIVSGGHTLLVQVRGLGDYQIVGRTVDDAAGEAFDKVAKLLGLGYPGGPIIEARAEHGDQKKFDLPRSMINSGDLNFSFSGLKTALRYLLRQPSVIPKRQDAERGGCKEDAPEIARFARDDNVVNDLCASFQQAIIDVLREKSLRALQQGKLQLLTLSGGVSCNRALRQNLRAMCNENRFQFLAAEPWLCTDNAAMIAFAAMLRLEKGIISDVTEEIDPNLALA